ncbi:MAG TPA: hypothetical protein VI727_08150 [Candidatus Brocadiaceae bacterium]|nr:hypothetical protein [Candidatus Brocadiaceae bacterium]
MMADTYLRGPKRKVTPLDYDDRRCETMITVNGKPMSIEQFRALKAKGKKKNHVGMGIWVTKKA